MTPILIGTALALAALGFVLFPLFREELYVAPGARAQPVRIRSTTAVDALREIEFDHVTGKLSESDYSQLKATYTERALTVMRHEADGGSAVICPNCGPRPEAKAAFCSNCGRTLGI